MRHSVLYGFVLYPGHDGGSIGFLREGWVVVGSLGTGLKGVRAGSGGNSTPSNLVDKAWYVFKNSI